MNFLGRVVRKNPAGEGSSVGKALKNVLNMRERRDIKCRREVGAAHSVQVKTLIKKSI